MKGLLFDLDGTLWDSSHTLAMAWNHVEGKPRVDKHDVQALLGHTKEGIASQLFPDLSIEEGLNMMDTFFRSEADFVRRYGGELLIEEETLEELAKDYILGIVSNCQKGYIEDFLKFSGWGKYFSGNLCYGETLRPKGENILTLMNQLGLSESIYIGDTILDKEAAEYAKIPFVASHVGFNSVSGKYIVKDYRDLKGILVEI